MMKTVALGAILLAVAAILYIRLAPDDMSRWHVDPDRAVPSGKPNAYLVAGADAVFVPLPPRETLLLLDDIAQSEPRTGLYAGGVEEGHATYIQRSALLRYPDYISVKATGAEGGSRLSLYSRSRYGYSDLGVNEARIKRWVDELESRAKN